MQAQIKEGLQSLSVADIKLSATAAQAERRKHFDKEAIAELAASIKTVGLINPITVRPVNGHYELVAGERRFLAAQHAKLPSIIASIRDLSDELVLEVQLIENLQREGLHELAEAEGYEQLQKLGHSAAEIADKVGKSKAYVYARMKLLALGPAPREAFYRGELNASTALLLARIPSATLQREACGKITKDYRDGVMSYRDARDFIEREYMLRLADAPFPTGDEKLLPKVGACGACPKRTGNQPELFGDIKSADVCTDPSCFKLKREAFGKLQIEEAQAAGRPIIVGTEAKKIVDGGHYHDSEHLKYNSGYAKLEDTCWEDPKHRTYKQLLGKGAETIALKLPKSGDVIQVIDKAKTLKQLKADGVIKREKPAAGANPYKEAKKEQLLENAYLDRLFAAVHAKAPKKLSKVLLVALADHELDVGGSFPQSFFDAWGWEEGAGIKELEKLSEQQLCQVLFEMQFCAYERFETDKLELAAKGLGIDAKKIRKEVAAAQAAPPAVATKKKAKGKK